MAGTGRRNVIYWLVAVAVITVVVGLLGVPSSPAAPSGWNIVPSASTGPQDSNLLLATACPNAWNCWAVGGSFPNLSNNGKPSVLVNHWDGSSWSVAPIAPPTGTDASLLWDVTCLTASDCWAVGGQELSGNPAPSTLAEHWDGSGWSVAPTPGGFGYLFSVTCLSDSDCWAAGTSVAADNSGPLNGIIDHWDGTTWSPEATAPSGQTYDQFNSVACTGPADCWAVGFAGPNQQQNNFLPNVAPNVAGAGAFTEHWDGASWSTVGMPQATAPLGTYLSGVTCTSSSQCWAVGATMDAAGDPSATLVDRWDGSSWTAEPSPSPSPTSGLLTAVTCLDGSDCWAVGAYGYVTGQSGAPTPFVESWNGSQWSIEPSPDVTAFGYLDGVACVRGAMCVASGLALTNSNNNSATIGTLVEQLQLPAAGNQGLWLTGSDGGVFSFGNAAFYGSTGAVRLNAPIVGMAPTPGGGGYWLVAADGGVFSFGNARFAGSTGALHLNRPVVGMAPTPDGGGYWLVAADGGVFSFGDARFAGSTGALHLNRPVVGMAPTPDGGGYWLVAADGGVFSFGDARFLGSMGAVRLNAPIVGMAPTPDGGGYWLVASDGGVFSFGDAGYWGSVPGQGIGQAQVVGMARTPDGRGYWLVDQSGGVYAYGDAGFLGSLTGARLAGPITGVAAQ